VCDVLSTVTLAATVAIPLWPNRTGLQRLSYTRPPLRLWRAPIADMYCPTANNNTTASVGARIVCTPNSLARQKKSPTRTLQTSTPNSILY